MIVRINVALARAGLTSRRGADELIKQGKIRLNGVVHTKLGVQIDDTKDVLEFSKAGRWVKLKRPSKKVTYALYKPYGYLTAMTQVTPGLIVKKLIPDDVRVNPVGKLEKEVEGLLLLTNDSLLSKKLTDPSTAVPLVYEARCTAPRSWTEAVAKRQLGRIKNVQLISYKKSNDIVLHITLPYEKHKAIQKLLATLNITVEKLKRIAIGDLKLADLNLTPGKWVEIDPERYF